MELARGQKIVDGVVQRVLREREADPLLNVVTETWETAVRVLQRRFPDAFTERDPVPFRTAVFRIHVDSVSGRRTTLSDLGTRIDWLPGQSQQDEVTLRVADTLEVRRWILGYGVQAEVVAPEGLREAMRLEAEGLAMKLVVSLP